MKRNTTKVIIPIIKGNNINKLNQSQKFTDFNTKIVDEMDYNFDYGESSIQISKNSFLKDVELLIKRGELIYPIDKNKYNSVIAQQGNSTITTDTTVSSATVESSVSTVTSTNRGGGY